VSTFDCRLSIWLAPDGERPGKSFDLDALAVENAEAEILFPTHLGGSARLDRRGKTLTVKTPAPYGARLIEIRPKG
jgi:hypothetical protein